MNRIEVLIKEKDVRARIKEMADCLSENYAGEDVVLIGTLNGAAFFLAELAQKMSIPVRIDFLGASSYGSGTESSGEISVTKGLKNSIAGKHVILVEDIIDTGRTLKTLFDMLKQEQPASLATAALLDKPSRRINDFKADYIGFQVPDEFLVGWGLDYDEKYRDLTFVGVMMPAPREVN